MGAREEHGGVSCAVCQPGSSTLALRACLALSGRGHSAGSMHTSKRDVQLRSLVKVTVSFLSF